MAQSPLTLLHLSDTQFGRHHRFGSPASDDPNESFDSLLSRLIDDLKILQQKHDLNPQVVLLTGDLAEWGMEDEYLDVLSLAEGLADHLAIPRRQVVMIPGNHDVNRSLCEAHFAQCKARRKEPIPPYWDKWEFFAQCFDTFYRDEPDIQFTQSQPWSLFEMPELKLVVAGLNSTWAESHLEEDEQKRFGHYGWLGEGQLRWFAEQLQRYQADGWFRVAALHHNYQRKAVLDDENLRDADDFEKYLGGLVNLIVHGHTHDGKAAWLNPSIPILAAGSAAVKAPQRPEETPNQYQIIRLWPDRYQRWTRSYYPGQKAWGGDNRATDKLDDWKSEKKVEFFQVSAAFPDTPQPTQPAVTTPRAASPAGPDPQEIQTYRATLENRHKEILVAGFKTPLRAAIDLEELYVPLQAMIDLRGSGDGHFADAEEAAMKLREQGSDIALIEAFKQAKARKRGHLVILGDPGSGKTTHLKRLVLQVLRRGAESIGLEPGTLPVFLPLRDLDDIQQGIAAFIEQSLDSPHLNMAAGFGKRLLQRGHLLLLFDGLDEVAEATHRAKVAHWIEQAVEAWPTCRAVVTCRFAGYDEHSRLDARFLELHLRPMTQTQAEDFIRNWYKVVETGLNPGPSGELTAREKADELVERLREPDFRSAKMATMTRNPLLLTNLCLVHRDRGGILPKGRHELYDECIDVLLERWREAKPRRDGKSLGVSIPAALGRQALQPVALWLHSQEGRTRASAEELAPILDPILASAKWEGGDARQFLQTLRDESGILTGWSHQHYGFMHLGFQEYLAAREIRRLAIAEAFHGSTKVLAELAGHYAESWWQEVILLLLAQGDPALFEPFMKEALRQRGFAEDKEYLDMVLEDSVGVTADPFEDLLNQEPSTDEILLNNQKAALQVLHRIAPEKIEKLSFKLDSHPLPVVRAFNRAWMKLKGGATQTGDVGRKEPVLSFVEGTRPTYESQAPAIIRSRNGEVELVRIPGGRFLMGSPQGQGNNDEHPQHEVIIQPFYLGRYPVTNEEYARFLKAKLGTPEPKYWADRRYNQARQPVVGVSLPDAQKFTQWAGGRLPTEAEWEYACRAGTATAYFWGDPAADINEYAWYWDNAGGSPHPVGEKRPNDFGLYEMTGNVWEWIQDGWHEDYQGAPTDGSAWEQGKNGRRVVRGGSWNDRPEFLRSAYRGVGDPVGRGILGFRLAQDI